MDAFGADGSAGPQKLYARDGREKYAGQAAGFMNRKVNVPGAPDPLQAGQHVGFVGLGLNNDGNRAGCGGGYFERQSAQDRTAWNSDEEDVDDFGRPKKKRKTEVAAPKAKTAK